MISSSSLLRLSAARIGSMTWSREGKTRSRRSYEASSDSRMEFSGSTGSQPRFLIRDRDRSYGADFIPKAARIGIETVLTPVRAPNANAIAERVIGTLRRECLDHFIVVNERHLRRVLREYVEHYNGMRPHRSGSVRSQTTRLCRPTIRSLRARRQTRPKLFSRPKWRRISRRCLRSDRALAVSVNSRFASAAPWGRNIRSA